MKFNKYIIMCLGAVSMSLASCNDFLDQLPDERTDIDSEDKVDKLLVSAYPSYNAAWLLELESDNLIDNQAPHIPSNPYDKQVLSHYNYSHYYKWHNEVFKFDAASSATYSDYDSPGAAWSYYYSSIATTNQAINAMKTLGGNDPSKFTDAMKASWAEAHLLRAYSHFMLANVFCDAWRSESLSQSQVGVPYVTTCEDKVQQSYDRGNLAETYKKIGEDLEEGLEYVSDVNYTTAPKYHFNVNAAHAFASRYYLYKRNYKKVIAHCNAVLNTDTTETKKMLMNYGIFGDCSSIEDFGIQWQSPDLNNNLMLLCTNSLLYRSTFGYRYSCASVAARDALMIHSSDFWSGYICPAFAVVSASCLSSSSADYGFTTSKIYEQFEYTNKLAGIGYPHIILRAFTANSLLLERAEAEIMLGLYDDASDDLCLWWNSAIDSFSDTDKQAYSKYINRMTKAGILKWYSKENAKKAEDARVYYEDLDDAGGSSMDADISTGEKTGTGTKLPKDETYNRFSDWSFTQQVSPDFVVPEEAIPYMNCLNDLRRWETVFEGQRMCDIKRWGMPLTHRIGADSEVYKSLPFNYSRAVEVPWETLSAGMATSKPEVSTNTGASARASVNVDQLKSE